MANDSLNEIARRVADTNPNYTAPSADLDAGAARAEQDFQRFPKAPTPDYRVETVHRLIGASVAKEIGVMAAHAARETGQVTAPLSAIVVDAVESTDDGPVIAKLRADPDPETPTEEIRREATLPGGVAGDILDRTITALANTYPTEYAGWTDDDHGIQLTGVYAPRRVTFDVVTGGR